MTMFKEGDLVKIVNDNNYTDVPVGTVTTLVKAYKGPNQDKWYKLGEISPLLIWFSEDYPKHGPYFLGDDNLEPVMIPEPGVNCAF